MKYCTYCGKELRDEAVTCPGCGCQVEGASVEKNEARVKDNNNTLNMVAKIFLLISCVVMGIWIIPLAWNIPITVSVWGRIRDERKISTGMKVCILIFCNTIAGVLLLCRDESIYKD